MPEVYEAKAFKGPVAVEAGMSQNFLGNQVCPIGRGGTRERQHEEENSGGCSAKEKLSQLEENLKLL